MGGARPGFGIPGRTGGQQELVAARRCERDDQRGAKHQGGEEGHGLQVFRVPQREGGGRPGDSARCEVPSAFRAHRIIRGDEAALGADPHGGLHYSVLR